MSRNDIGILFVHGIAGNARIFQFLDDVVPADASCVRLTLQGHGGDALGFSRASMRTWEKQVEEAAAELRRKYSKVIIVGHSMGCLLALGESVRPDIDGFLLINPPLRLRIRTSMFRNSLKATFGMTEGDEVAKAAVDAYGITLDKNPFHYYGWAARFFELFRKMGKTRQILRELQLQSTAEVFLSAHDEMVSTRSAKYFSTEAGCRVTILPSSGHYYYTLPDRKLMRDALQRILQQI
ncbi:MAG: alpha/beta hydrolase [Muribaculaceae bacterium]|nr:alpha/beta hydrolase [Muribaculaceae bacterium]